MKKLLLLFSLLAGVTQLTNAQTPNWLWAEESGGGSFQYPNGIFIDATDSLYIAGRYASTMSYGTGPNIMNGNDNPFIAKLDSSGNGKWIQEISYGYYDYPWGFWVDAKGNSYSAGVVSSGASMFIEKYDRNGNLKWDITPSGGGIAGQGMAVDGAGCVYVTGDYDGSVTLGSTTLNSGGNQAIFVAKLDSTGNFLWAKSATATGYQAGRGMTIDANANVYVLGGYIGNATFGGITAPASTGYANLVIAEYDSTGTAVNVITATNAGFDNGDCCNLKGITIDSCNNLYVTGYFENTAQFGGFSLTSLGGKDVFVAKCNNAGNWQWANDIGSTGDDYAQAITLDKNSDVYVAGDYSNGSAMFGSTPVSGGFYFVAKYANSTGDLQWAQSAGTSVNGGGIGGVTVDKQGYVYIIGDFGNNTSDAFGSIILNSTSNSNIVVAKLDTVAPRSIIPIIDSSYCQGSTAVIPYTVIGTFNSGNAFTVELSDSSGSFVNDSIIGSATSTTGGTINIKIPSSIPTGSNYLIRVVSSNPATSSYVNGCGAYFQQNVYPNDFYVKIGTGGINATLTPNSTICYGGSVTLKASGGATYLWNTTATADSIIVDPTLTTTYTVVIAKGSCAMDTSSTVVTVLAQGTATIEPPSPIVCAGQTILLTVDTTGRNYVWSPATGLNTSTGDSVVVTTSAVATYTVTGTDSLGCSVTGSDMVSVAFGPNKPIITVSETGDTLFSSAKNGNQWYLNGHVVHGATDSFYIINGLAGDTFTVVVINVANGCGTTSDSVIASGIDQLSINSDQLSVYPNPTNGDINVNISSSAVGVKDWNLQLTDVLGRTVYTRSSLNYTNQLDLSNLPGGIYFITVISKTARAVVPVVKQN